MFTSIALSRGSFLGQEGNEAICGALLAFYDVLKGDGRQRRESGWVNGWTLVKGRAICGTSGSAVVPYLGRLSLST